MRYRTTLRTLLVLSGIGTAISALHCSSSGSSSSATSCADADPTTIRHLTAAQQAVLTRAADHTKATLSAAEWRYLFKLRYARFSRATVETDPVVVKALATIAGDAAACPAAAKTRPSSVDVCERFTNVDKCWTDSPVSTAIVPCFMWSMMIASSDACAAPSAPGTTHVDSQAWDDSQDGKEMDTCVAPCIAGGSCLGGTCRCSPDEAPCVGGCGRKKSDVVNCGACGTTCPAALACVEGVCGGTADAGADAGGDEDGGDGGDGG